MMMDWLYETETTLIYIYIYLQFVHSHIIVFLQLAVFRIH